MGLSLGPAEFRAKILDIHLPAARRLVIEQLDHRIEADVLDQPCMRQARRFDGNNGQGQDMQGIPVSITDWFAFFGSGRGFRRWFLGGGLRLGLRLGLCFAFVYHRHNSREIAINASQSRHGIFARFDRFEYNIVWRGIAMEKQ